MLILTRRIGETVVIEGGIEVTVMDIKGSQVRVGIKAPEDVVVLRSELLTKVPPPDARRNLC